MLCRLVQVQVQVQVRLYLHAADGNGVMACKQARLAIQRFRPD